MSEALSLYDVLKSSKMGLAPDMWTALAGMNLIDKGSGHEIKELTGIPPLSFRANGIHLLDYLISGNMSQTGTPTPTNPIQPQECGDMTRNLFDNVIETGYYDDSGTLILAPTTSHSTNYIPVNGTTYTASGLWYSTGQMYRFAVYEWDENKNWLRRSNRQYPPNSNEITFTIGSDTAYITLQIQSGHNGIMLNTGSTALPYEPYRQYKIPILSANISTNVYLGEVPTTRKIKKLVLNGTEGWQISTNGSQTRAFISEPIRNIIGSSCPICTHYKGVPGGGGYPAVGDIIINSQGTIIIGLENGTTIGDWQSYLAAQYANGTPVIIWYVLATPKTGILNEPLRKIGDYADTISYEQAGVQIPTLNGQTVINIETTLKPSEMYIKYQ